ncbi:MFS transporter [Dyella subtropica]|uniref:MFS transporter n=1 Tax=Dyella subtropica TaxID=2992127 RepID=UPI0022539CBB|nr:MFS transporter [Dyella subtropica]
MPLSDAHSPSTGMPVSLVRVLALGHCAAFADRNLLAVAAPLLKADLSLSDTQLGLLDGPAFALLYAVGMLASWPLASSRHRFRLLAGCIATWALGMVVFALGRSFGMLIAARALIGLGQSAFVPLALGLIVECAAWQWRGRSMAVFTAASAAGRSLALLMGGTVLAFLARWIPVSGLAHWRLLFLVMAVPNLALIAMLLRRVEQPPVSLPSAAVFRQLLASFWRRPGAMCTYLCGAGASVLVVQTVGAWAPSVLHREQGLAPAAAALAFGVALLVAAPLGHLIAGTLIDTRGKSVTPMAVVAGALLIAVPLLWVVPRTTSAAAACGFLALTSLVGGTAAVAALAGLPMLLPAPLRDAGLRLFLVFITVLGVGLGPFVAGLVSDGMGAGGHGLSTALYVVCAGAAVFGVASALLARAGWHRAVVETAG